MGRQELLTVLALMATTLIWAAVPLKMSSQSAVTDYTYDALGRLVTVVQSDGEQINYSYDDAGNRINLDSSASGGSSNNLPPVVQNVTYISDPSESWVFHYWYMASDPEGGPLTFTTTDSGSIGNQSQTIYWSAPGNGPTNRQIIYTVEDSAGNTAIGTINIIVESGGFNPPYIGID